MKIFLIVWLLFVSAVTWDVEPSQEQEQVFDQVFKQLTEYSRCFPAGMMYYRYKFEMETIYKKTLVPNKKQLKCHLDILLSRYNISKRWPHLASQRYEICVQENDNYKKLTEPPTSVLDLDLSISGTLAKYPYLKEYMNPEKLSELLMILPQNIRQAYHIYRYTVIDGKLFNESYYFDKQIGYNKYFKAIAHQLPNLDFIIFVRSQLHPKIIYEINEGVTNDFVEYDGKVELHKNIILHLPGFMDAKNVYSEIEFNKFLLVDLNKLDRYWAQRITDIEAGVKEYPWQNKIDKAYYRSDVKGLYYGNVDVYTDIPQYFPRLNLMNMSDHHHDLIDAEFSGNQSSWEADFKKVGYQLKNQIFQDTQNKHLLKYKYLISMDGWAMSRIKLPLILHGNSVLIKPVTGKVVWFSNDLIPNVHYVPVHADLSNLVSEIQHLKKNDLIAKDIVRNANEFFKNNLMYHQTVDKMISILNDYSKIQKFVPLFITKVLYQNYHKTLMIDRITIVRGLHYYFFLALLMILGTYVAFEIAQGLIDKDIEYQFKKDKERREKMKEMSKFKDHISFEQQQMDTI